MDQTREEIVAEAHRALELRWDIEAFLDSKPGRYLCERSEQKRTEALEKLKDVDAEDAKAIRALQMEIAVCDTWQEWLGEAITEGRHAEERLIETQ